ncbi:MAG: hypothetical protein K2J15_04275 [Muribaculaceae bacterium]|nr:hypothetical protein [Muribaculaceae bacterium]
MNNLRNIHIFNPEADYSLADFTPGFTPPKSVIRLRRALAHTPLRYADPEKDFLLLLDDIDPEVVIARTGKTGKIPEIIPPSRHKEFFKYVYSHSEDYAIKPWGWTPDLRHRLRQSGAPQELLPGDDTLLIIRRLSHRARTIEFNSIMNEHLSIAGLSEKHHSPLPFEFKNETEALQYLVSNKDVFFKYPWSSSGRGIFHADLSTPADRVSRWISGGIRRQGSIMAELTFDKLLDFATEWKIIDGIPEFIGVSVFNADSHGNYRNNIAAPQRDLMKLIQKYCPDFGEEYIKAQSASIREMAKGYTGFLGIDMMAGKEGSSRACVELNFRMTMGIVALLESGMKNSISV